MHTPTNKQSVYNIVEPHKSDQSIYIHISWKITRHHFDDSIVAFLAAHDGNVFGIVEEILAEGLGFLYVIGSGALEGAIHSGCEAESAAEGRAGTGGAGL